MSLLFVIYISDCYSTYWHFSQFVFILCRCKLSSNNILVDWPSNRKTWNYLKYYLLHSWHHLFECPSSIWNVYCIYSINYACKWYWNYQRRPLSVFDVGARSVGPVDEIKFDKSGQRAFFHFSRQHLLFVDYSLLLNLLSSYSDMDCSYVVLLLHIYILLVKS